MNRALAVSDRAARDIDAAHAEYREHGVGAAFMAAIDRAFDRMSERPLMFPVIYDSVRRVLLRRFPLAVFFVVEDSQVVVLAVSYQRSDPANRPRR
jgi:toxin ParE1/3/4